MRYISLILISILATGCGLEDQGQTVPDGEVTDSGGEVDMGEGGQVGEADMGPEGGVIRDPLPTESETCDAACDRMVECAIDVCVAVERTDADRVHALCADACVTVPSFGMTANRIEFCDELVAFGRDTLDPQFEMQCSADSPPPIAENPECVTFGDRVLECIVPQCPPAADVSTVFAAAYTSICNETIADGDFELMELQTGLSMPCDTAPWPQAIDEEVSRLARFCADGPLVDPQTCADGCAVLSPCQPSEESVSNEAACQLFCMSNPEPSQGFWACIGEANTCEAARQCLLQ
jgi:hypothetical protein